MAAKSSSKSSTKSWSGTIGWVKVSYSSSWWKTTYNVWGKSYNSVSAAANAIKSSPWYSKSWSSSSGSSFVDPSVLHDAQVNWLSASQIDAKWWTWAAAAVNNYDKQYWTNSFAKSWWYSWWGSSGYNQKIANNINNMKFWADVYKAWSSYNTGSRNQQISDLMKQNWIKATNAQDVKSFLEMYSPGYKEASDEDKNNTANKIFWLYSPASNDDTLNMWEDLNSSKNSDIDYSEIDWLLNEEWWNNDEDLQWEEHEQTVEEMLAERDRQWQQKLDDMRYEYENQYLNNLEEWVDGLSNNQTEEKKWLSDAEKEANTAASAAAWNAAQWWNNAEAEAATAEQPATQPVVNSENYWDRQTKIMNILWNLWYNIETAPSEQAENQEVWAVLEWWEPVEWAEEQAAIAESNATNWEETPTYTDEPSLVTSYQKAFDNLLQQWPSPETAKEAIKTYLQAKDAAALFTVQNNLSDEAYQNILNQIKSVPSLKDLLKNYNK